ncbi:sigma-70 family RNA polymerase sigma factor [Aquiluna sp.]|nr:sigma-70 family RNA polymerase sigma factor [Aquiluna sp.]
MDNKRRSEHLIGLESSHEVLEGQPDNLEVLGLFEEGETLILRDWTARDFSHAYVRLRPHLERHAARYLRDPSQVEEVVQDAFLYLMTALPELDSEIGVLRFLKWKTKMLALDVIRLNSKYSVSSIQDFELDLEIEGQDEVSLRLERADDASIVSMALSKLSPRQRQAIVETQLLEKPVEEVASEMGLSNNAFRQLLHRARAAFKSALVGEAEIRGLPVSAILSIAARKAARESGKLIAGASALIVAIFGLASIPQSPEVPTALSERGGSLIAEAPRSPSGIDQTGQFDEANSADVPSAGLTEDTAAPLIPSEEEADQDVRSNEAQLSQSSGPSSPAPEQEDTAEIALASAVEEFLVLQTFDVARGYEVDTGEEVVIKSGGITATFGIDLDSDNPVQFVYVTAQLPQGEVVAVPTNGLSVVESSSFGRVVSYAATDFIVGDLQGAHGNAASASTQLQGYALLLSFTDTEGVTIDVTNFSFEGKTKA